MEGTARNVTSDRVATATITEFVSWAGHPKKSSCPQLVGLGRFYGQRLVGTFDMEIKKRNCSYSDPARCSLGEREAVIQVGKL